MLRFLLLQITLAGILAPARLIGLSSVVRLGMDMSALLVPKPRAAAHLERNQSREMEDPYSAQRLVHAAILDNQVWLTTASVGGNDSFVLCVDATSGEIRLNQKLFHSDSPEPLGNNVNAYARPHPQSRRAGCTSISAATVPLAWTHPLSKPFGNVRTSAAVTTAVLPHPRSSSRTC
jgi:hypothetical protein